MKTIVIFLIASIIGAQANSIESFNTAGDYFTVTYDTWNGLFTLCTGPSHPVGDKHPILFGGDTGSPLTSYTTVRTQFGTYVTSEDVVDADPSAKWLGSPDSIDKQETYVSFKYTVSNSDEEFDVEVKLSVDDLIWNMHIIITEPELIVPTKRVIVAPPTIPSGVYDIALVLDYTIDTDNGPTFRTVYPESPRYKTATIYNGSLFESYVMEPNKFVHNYYSITGYSNLDNSNVPDYVVFGPREGN